MPKPIVCLSEPRRRYVDIFRSCFSQRQWKYLRKRSFRVIVLLGLVECEERKTMSGLLRVIGERISLSGLSRFLNQWPWSPEKVARTWMSHFRQRLEGQVQAEHAHLKAEEDWIEVIWPSAEGGQKLYAHLLSTWIRKLGPTLLLITCHDLDEPLKTVR